VDEIQGKTCSCHFWRKKEDIHVQGNKRES
jgi:hypothetical protein